MSHPRPHRYQTTLLQALRQTRFDIGSSSILWDVEKEFNVGGATDEECGNISPDRDSYEAASIWWYWSHVLWLRKGTAMHSDVSITLPAVAEIAPVSGQAALSLNIGPRISYHEQPSLSIVIPTRNETDNIEPLVGALKQALANVAMEIIF